MARTKQTARKEAACDQSNQKECTSNRRSQEASSLQARNCCSKRDSSFTKSQLSF